MNDWLDYKGSGSSRAYMGDTIGHGFFREKVDKVVKVVGDEMNSQKKGYADAHQKVAYKKLIYALIEKANKILDEFEAADASVAEISATIRDKTRKDKNYNTNGLLQRKKTYLLRRTAASTELDKTIKEISETCNKVWKEIGYSSFEYLAGNIPDSDVDRELRRIDNRRKLLLRLRNPIDE